MAINKFLDTSCHEVLESSQRQYMKRKFLQVGEGLPHSHYQEQRPSVLSLRNELQELKLDLATAQKWRAVKNSRLGAAEEEVECLATALAMPDNKKKTETILYFKEELHRLKCDLKELGRKYNADHNNKSTKTVEIPLFGDIKSDSENYKTKSNIVKEKLLRLNIGENTVSAIMDIVARRVEGQCV